MKFERLGDGYLLHPETKDEETRLKALVSEEATKVAETSASLELPVSAGHTTDQSK